MSPSVRRDRNRDLIGGRTAARLGEREELAAGFNLLSPRDRLLLFLWYVEEWPVAKIAEHIGLSRKHCYRIRDRSLQTLSSAA